MDTKTGKSPPKTASPTKEPKNVKERIAILRDYINQVNSEIMDSISVVKKFRITRNESEKKLVEVGIENKNVLVTEIAKLQEEMKKSFVEQKSENIRLQQAISVIKVEITETNATTLGIGRSISQLEQYLGKEEPPN